MSFRGRLVSRSGLDDDAVLGFRYCEVDDHAFAIAGKVGQAPFDRFAVAALEVFTW